MVNKWLFYYTNLNWLAAQKVYIWNFLKTIHIVGIFPIVEIEIWVMFRSPIESQNVREMLWLLIAENVTRKCFSYSANWSGHPLDNYLCNFEAQWSKNCSRAEFSIMASFLFWSRNLKHMLNCIHKKHSNRFNSSKLGKLKFRFELFNKQRLTWEI